MDQAVDGGDRHCLVRKHLVPGGERRIGREGNTFAFVAFGNQFEEHGGLRLISSRIAEIVQDDQVEAVELGQFGGQTKVATRRLQALHDLAGSYEQHFVAAIDERMADAGNHVGLAHARRTKG